MKCARHTLHTFRFFIFRSRYTVFHDTCVASQIIFHKLTMKNKQCIDGYLLFVDWLPWIIIFAEKFVSWLVYNEFTLTSFCCLENFTKFPSKCFFRSLLKVFPIYISSFSNASYTLIIFPISYTISRCFMKKKVKCETFL